MEGLKTLELLKRQGAVAHIEAWRVDAVMGHGRKQGG